MAIIEAEGVRRTSGLSQRSTTIQVEAGPAALTMTFFWHQALLLGF